jgi:hypothetical protein
MYQVRSIFNWSYGSRVEEEMPSLFRDLKGLISRYPDVYAACNDLAHRCTTFLKDIKKADSFYTAAIKSHSRNETQAAMESRQIVRKSMVDWGNKNITPFIDALTNLRKVVDGIILFELKAQKFSAANLTYDFEFTNKSLKELVEYVNALNIGMDELNTKEKIPVFEDDVGDPK